MMCMLFHQNFCDIGLENRALQSPRRRETGWKQDTMKKRVEHVVVVSDVAISKRGRGEFIFCRTLSVADHEELATKYYLFDYDY